eukprot:UN0997
MQNLGSLPREKGTIFRIKAILAVKGYKFKRVFHAVMDVTDEDDAGPWLEGEKKVSKIVFIGKALDQAFLQQGFEAIFDASLGTLLVWGAILASASLHWISAAQTCSGLVSSMHVYFFSHCHMRGPTWLYAAETARPFATLTVAQAAGGEAIVATPILEMHALIHCCESMAMRGRDPYLPLPCACRLLPPAPLARARPSSHQRIVCLGGVSSWHTACHLLSALFVTMQAVARWLGSTGLKPSEP